MCLSTVDEVKPNYDGFGYKVMNKRGGYYESEFRHGDNRSYYPGEEYVAKESFIPGTLDRAPYESGFHIFTTYSGALWWRSTNQVIVKVKYRGAHTQGGQLGYTCIVAKYMTILGQV